MSSTVSFRRKEIIDCISFLLMPNKLPQNQQLKTAPVDHLTILEVRSPGGLTGFSAQGLTRLTLRCWPGWVFNQKARGITHFMLTRDAGRVPFYAVVGLGNLFPFWLSARGEEPLSSCTWGRLCLQTSDGTSVPSCAWALSPSAFSSTCLYSHQLGKVLYI